MPKPVGMQSPMISKAQTQSYSGSGSSTEPSDTEESKGKGKGGGKPDHAGGPNKSKEGALPPGLAKKDPADLPPPWKAKIEGEKPEEDSEEATQSHAPPASYAEMMQQMEALQTQMVEMTQMMESANAGSEEPIQIAFSLSA